MGLFSHRAAMKRIITLDKIQSPLREMRPASCISDSKDQKKIVNCACHVEQTPHLFHICLRTILTLSAFHIGRKVALDAQAAAFVYIYARSSQIAEMRLSFYATVLVEMGTVYLGLR